MIALSCVLVELLSGVVWLVERNCSSVCWREICGFCSQAVVRVECFLYNPQGLPEAPPG